MTHITITRDGDHVNVRISGMSEDLAIMLAAAILNEPALSSILIDALEIVGSDLPDINLN